MDLGEEMEKNFMKSLNWAKLGLVLLRQSANELSVSQCVTTPRQLPPSESVEEQRWACERHLASRHKDFPV